MASRLPLQSGSRPWAWVWGSHHPSRSRVDGVEGGGGGFTVAALGGGPTPEDFGLVGEAFAGTSIFSGPSLSLSFPECSNSDER